MGFDRIEISMSKKDIMEVQLKNFGFKHKSGVLLPVSALPNRYGIGSFGKCAFDFVDFLSETGTKCWQVLPLNPTSYGDSPYQSPASVAGNPYYIDLDVLHQKGLLTQKDLAESKHNTKRVDYGWLFFNRYPTLRKAYARFVKKGDEAVEYNRFARANKSWIEDYALFMALKVNNGYTPWTMWQDEHKDVNKARKLAKSMAEECGFWKWVQFEFFTQWNALKRYAKQKGIVIVGDMPIYVAHDSMDVWQNPSQFLLDEKYNPTVVAGVPPDAFSADGQLWGNPIYNWKTMQNDRYGWWKNRVGRCFKLYDILRIDHFRGFSGYYVIPAGDTTAKNGHWESAPGVELFEEIKRAYPKAKIIAEDLGVITDDVRELLTNTGFPGMKVLQFAFGNDNNEYLPRLYKNANCVVYTGSHDSECTLSWLRALDKDSKKRLDKECARKTHSRTYDFIYLALSSPANLAVIPLQDYMELVNEQGRINTPSKAEGNWDYRLSPAYNKGKLADKIKDITKATKRAK